MATNKKSLAEAARQILTEAAVDTLQWDGTHNQEPLHKPEDIGDPSAAVVDLGGATNQNPSGGPVGKITAAHRSQMAAPKGPEVGPEGMHTEKGNPEADEGEPDAEPTMATADGNAPLPDDAEEAQAHGYATRKEEVTAEDIEAARLARLQSIRETMRSVSVEEDINAMFAGTELSAEFRDAVKTVFEAAVVARAVVVVEQLEKEILEASEQAVEEIREELENNVDAYLDHMVTEWMNKNQVAIQSGLKAELAEEFMEDLRGVFVKHNLDIPEDKVDVVEGLTAQVEKLQAQINEVLNTNVELNHAVNESKKNALIASVCEGLTATQSGKFKTLAEGVEFVTEDEYKGKLGVIKSQYFQVNTKVAASNPVALNESADPSPVQVEEVTDPTMRHYAAAITRTVKAL